MTALAFIKMHGAGNDYVFVDGFRQELPNDPSTLTRQMSDRHFGVGADGLVYLIPPANDDVDVDMKMWNADGSEGAMCGNALRCIALLRHRDQPKGTEVRIGTMSGIVPTRVLRTTDDFSSGVVTADLPGPVFPDGGQSTLELPPQQRAALNGGSAKLHFTQVSVGNPHIVVFVDQLTDRCVRQLGSALSTHTRFPDGTNVEWVRIVSATELEVRVWERGSGETLACGSGACATVAAAIRGGYCQRDESVDVRLPGGVLSVCWNSPTPHHDDTLELTGPAEISFEGMWQQ